MGQPYALPDFAKIWYADAVWVHAAGIVIKAKNRLDGLPQLAMHCTNCYLFQFLLTTREVAWYIISVVSVYVCMSV